MTRARALADAISRKQYTTHGRAHTPRRAVITTRPTTICRIDRYLHCWRTTTDLTAVVPVVRAAFVPFSRSRRVRRRLLFDFFFFCSFSSFLLPFNRDDKNNDAPTKYYIIIILPRAARDCLACVIAQYFIERPISTTRYTHYSAVYRRLVNTTYRVCVLP